MNERRRHTLLGTDYDGLDFPGILDELANIISSFDETAKNLIPLKRMIEQNENIFLNPEELFDRLNYCSSLFSDFKLDLERIREEVPAGIQERHLECIKQIVERYIAERSLTRDFIKELFDVGLRNDPKRLSLEIADEIRNVLYAQFSEVRGKLSSLRRRMKVFLGRKPDYKVAKSVTNRTLIPFPAKPGTKWSQVSIRFLSSNAAELNNGEERRGNEFREIGFEDRKTGKYLGTWFILASFGQSEVLNEKDVAFLERFATRVKLIKQIQELNALLQNIFKIEGEKRPIVFDRKIDQYRRSFMVSLADPEIIEEIKDSFRGYSLQQGTPQDLKEMKFHREDKKK